MPRYNNINTQSRVSNPTSDIFADQTADGGIYSFGNYYTWSAALANTIAYAGPDSIDANNNTSETANTSICPSGWRIPYGRGTGNGLLPGGFYNLNYVLNNNSNATDSTAEMKLTAFPNNFIRAGWISASTIYRRGHVASYWSSSAYKTSVVQYWSAYYLSIGSSPNVLPGTETGWKYNGLSIRCVTVY